jgi:hypothetical protein
MNNITVLIAGDKNYRAMIENARRTTEALGYPTIIYDLGDLGFGKKFDGQVSTIPLQTIPCKPHLLADTLLGLPDDDYLVYLDADAIIQSRIDEICEDYDLGVTLRTKPAPDPRVSAINAGIVFVRNTQAARDFLRIWATKADELNGDQWALNALTELQREDMGQTVIKHNARIRCFPCVIYNNFYFKGDQSQAKILHYKSKQRKLYPFPK